uniref:Ig-like domain-containing protein n=1 Tax=Periophthalmus magnuspinnatus TaxID=409849 RepID=A0A3B4A8L1_9GOBI
MLNSALCFIDISPDYEGRASLDIDSSKLTSALHLTKVTMGDNGNFQCSVLIPGDDEGTSAATTFVLVLVPPSSPVCRIQGKAEYWQNITLTCVSEEGSPVPQYKWKTYSVENIPRAFPPKTTEKDGALSLRNISREMSGFYVCTSANRIGSVSCNLTLAVMPGGSMSGATVGIIGGVVGAVLLLAIVIFCCYRQKKKKAKAPGEIEFHDRDDIEGSDGYQENKIPKNHDIDITEQTQHSEKTGLEKLNVDMESTAGSHRSHSNQDRLDNNRDHYRDDHRGSRDRLDDHRGSRDRLDDYRGSRDRLDDHRGSRDRLDDYRGNREHHDDYRSSRDRLDEGSHLYGSRDHLDYSERRRYE